MQSLQKHLFTRNLKKIYNFKKNTFASDWTSNTQTGEVKTRFLNMNAMSVTNHFSVFNRNKLDKSRAKQAYYKPTNREEKDFPDNGNRIAFLTGGKKI
jgi:hypothetical protein